MTYVVKPTPRAASVQLHSHGDVASPRLWMNSDESCLDWWYYFVCYCVVNVEVTTEYLKYKRTKNLSY